MDLVFLSEEFYSDFGHYEEILTKEKRPYIMLLVCYNNLDFAVPFRSNVNHPHAFITSKENKNGIDFSKSVIITDKKYIVTDKNIKIREDEFKYIKDKKYEIKKQFSSYISKYIKSYQKIKSDNYHSRDFNLCKFSTLKNYHKHLGID